MASYSNSSYTNDFFDLNGIYFNSTSQTNSNINIDELDIRYLQKTGGTISNNLLINGSVDIQTSLTLPIGNIATLIESKQDLIDGLQTTLTELDELTSNHITQISSNDTDITSLQSLTATHNTDITALQGRLDTEEPKTTALQTLTATHTTDIASNTNNIASLDVDLFTEQQKTSALQTLTASHTTDIASLDTRLDTEEPKTTALQTLTASHTDDIASNTADILTKQDLITSSTDLTANSLTTEDLEVNGNIIINKKNYFDTIVIRLFNEASTTSINLNELQVSVNGSNILFPNSASLTGYFALWSNKEIDRGSLLGTSPVPNIYNNIIETEIGAHSVSGGNALIIKNIPLTSINEIQAIVLYNRTTSTITIDRAIGLFFELYNSTNDPDLTEALANTNVITTGTARYRYDFPSISTYTDFIGEDSITNILNNTFALTEVANVISFPTEITGDVVISGSITASDKYFYEANDVVKAFG